MSLYQTLAFLTAVFVSITAGRNDCITVSSIKDYSLIGHTYKSTSGKSLMTCIISCDQDAKCYSLNYKFPAKTCELNNVTRSLHLREFVFSPDTVYFDHPSRPSGSCSGDWPCENNGKCINVARFPGFKCECQHDYIGDTCKGNITDIIILWLHIGIIFTVESRVSNSRFIETPDSRANFRFPWFEISGFYCNFRKVAEIKVYSFLRNQQSWSKYVT